MKTKYPLDMCNLWFFHFYVSPTAEATTNAMKQILYFQILAHLPVPGS